MGCNAGGRVSCGAGYRRLASYWLCCGPGGSDWTFSPLSCWKGPGFPLPQQLGQCWGLSEGLCPLGRASLVLCWDRMNPRCQTWGVTYPCDGVWPLSAITLMYSPLCTAVAWSHWAGQDGIPGLLFP